jgi:hypothetical protein
MPFRVPGLDLIYPDAVSYLQAPSSPERPFQKGAEMLTLKDPILNAPPLTDGIELPPLREPEWLEMPISYVPSARTAVMTSKEFAEARSEASLRRSGSTGSASAYLT